MRMNETQVQEILDIERQKLAIHVAAVEARMDDKDRASETRMIDAITNIVTDAVVGLKAEIALGRDQMLLIRDELKGEIQDLRAEVKCDIHSLRTELAQAKADIAEAKADIAQVKEDVAQVKEDLARVEQKLDNHTH
jgi:chromosome segregation ATPase